MIRHPLTPIAGAIAGVAAGAAVVIVVGLLVSTATSSSENTETLQLIKSCTIEPAGKCARLQRQQSAYFARMIALSDSCADRPGYQTPAQIERCITKGMRNR